MDTIIENCKLINKTGNFNVGIKNGKIAKISKIPFEGSKKIDIKGNLLLPGFIDPHVHFRDPGLTQKEDFKTGSESAANGGFTTVIDMTNTSHKHCKLRASGRMEHFRRNGKNNHLKPNSF